MEEKKKRPPNPMPSPHPQKKNNAPKNHHGKGK
jgi:hypothetical protein